MNWTWLNEGEVCQVIIAAQVDVFIAVNSTKDFPKTQLNTNLPAIPPYSVRVKKRLDKSNKRNFWKRIINRTIISVFPKIYSMEEPVKKTFQTPKNLNLWKYLESRHTSCGHRWGGSVKNTKPTQITYN